MFNIDELRILGKYNFYDRELDTVENDELTRYDLTITKEDDNNFTLDVTFKEGDDLYKANNNKTIRYLSWTDLLNEIKYYVT